MKTARFAALLLPLLALGQVPAVAQTRLYVLFSGAPYASCTPADCEPGHLLEVDIDRQSLVRATFVQHARIDASSLGVTPDGRYLAWVGAETFGGPEATVSLSLFDASTTTQAEVASFGAQNGFSHDLFVHPTQQRAFILHTSAIRIAEPGTIRAVAAVSGCDRLWPTTVSGNGSRLFARCVVYNPTNTQITGTAVIDGASGSFVSMVADTATPQSSTLDGTTLFSAQATGISGPRYRRWDVATNSLEIERVTGSSNNFPSAMATDPRTGRLWVTLSGGTIEVLDATTLNSLARFPGGGTRYPNGKPAQISFDPAQPVAFVAWSERIDGSNPVKYRSQLRLIDTETLVPVLTAPLPFTSVVAGVAIAPRPPRPSGLSASVTGGQVSLQWSLGTGAPGSSTFVDAGSAPGLTNLASLVVTPGQTTFVAQGVPAGTYYVRVRTRTAGGVEAASNEVTVTVQ